MKPDISEFSYGYAVTEALVRGFGNDISAAPVFPSLVAEGREGGGYDVGIQISGIPLFLQFKLSDCMRRNSVVEVRRGLLAVPFYRMHLRPKRHSRQHELLLSLEREGNLVYYAAPLFHRPSELNDAYSEGCVLQRSVFIPPSAIGRLPDGNNHHVAFSPSACYVLSEPKRIEKPVDSNTLGRIVRSELQIRGRTALTADSLGRLMEQMIALLHDERQELRRLDTGDQQPLKFVAYLSRTFFGCEMLIVQYESP